MHSFFHCDLQLVDIIVLANIEQKPVEEVHDLGVLDDLRPELDIGQTQQELQLFQHLACVVKECVLLELLGFLLLLSRKVLLVRVVGLDEFVVQVVELVLEVLLRLLLRVFFEQAERLFQSDLTLVHLFDGSLLRILLTAFALFLRLLSFLLSCIERLQIGRTLHHDLSFPFIFVLFRHFLDYEIFNRVFIIHEKR